MNEPFYLDAVAQAELVRNGEVSPRELVTAAIERIEARNPKVNAVVAQWFDEALETAEHVDRTAPFAGVPTVVKVLDDYAGRPAHRASAWLQRSGRIAAQDSVVVARMKAAGFVILGQSSSPEFGLLSVSESRTHGITRNPWRDGTTAGGSSGGAAAAVAARMVPVAQGGDGGGSIRMPAAFCHCVGLKLTTGRISGGPAAADSFGHGVPGFITLTVRDTAAVVDAVAGPHPGDRRIPRTLPPGGLRGVQAATVGPLRIGVLDCDPTGKFDVDPEVRAAVRDTAALFEARGHKVEESHPVALGDQRALDAFVDTHSVGVAGSIDALSRELGAPPEADDLDPVTRYWEERGRRISGVKLAQTLAWQGDFRARMARWWHEEGFDLLLSPVFPMLPKNHGWPWAEKQGIPLSVDVLKFTAPFNTTGQPAISVPAGISSDGRPIGVQVVAAAGREDLLVAVASQFEEDRPWLQNLPPLLRSA